MRKIPRFFARNRNLCNFGLYFFEFGCHGNSLGTLENCNSIFEGLTVITAARRNGRVPRRSRGLIGLRPFWSAAILIVHHLKSPTQYPGFSCEKFLDFLHRTEFSAILAYFCSNLVAMGTPLVPLKIEIAYLKSSRLKLLTFHAKNSSISCEQLKSVQFCLIFVQIWLPWQLPWLP